MWQKSLGADVKPFWKFWRLHFAVVTECEIQTFLKESLNKTKQNTNRENDVLLRVNLKKIN